MSNPLTNFLSSLKLNALPSFAALQHGKIITVPKDAKIPETLHTLIENKITAVPVLEDDKPIAVVSIIELMNHFLNNFEEENLKREVKHTYDFFSLVISKKHVTQEKAAEIKELGNLEPVYSVNLQSSSFLEVVRLMVEKGTHRVIVVDEQGKLNNIITQSRIAQLLPFISDSAPKFKKSLKELNIAQKPVATVAESSSAISAFQLMRNQKISAVGVTDDKGVLIGNMSATDIKGLGYDLSFFELLGVTVKEYLKTVNKADLRSTEMKHSNVSLIRCRETDSLDSVVKLFNFYRIHRVYVTDEEEKPIGIVAIKDVLAIALQN